MIKISNLRIPASVGADGLAAFAADALGVSAGDIKALTILKRSVDARRKNDVRFVYTLALSAAAEEKILKENSGLAAPYTPPETYAFPFVGLGAGARPVVAGLGPAGLFAALCLAEAGLAPVVLERGKPVEERARDVERFWQTGALDEDSNVQFGEGGAGTFSDGKLTTGIGDERISYVLRRFVEFGAPEDILYLAQPHIGTDRLRRVVANLRAHLLTLGCDIRFGHRLAGLSFDGGSLRSAEVETGGEAYQLEAPHLILAPGNSARDTFEMLELAGVRLSAKNFSVGVRIEHLQKDIDLAQYRQAATLGTLPAADYKLAVHLKGGRAVYTFCVCPGGAVIASASGTGQVVTNGMSEYARDGVNCNGGLLVSVTPDDFGASPLSGVRFQEALERAAFTHGGGDYRAPAQLAGDFLARRPSRSCGTVTPTYRPGVRWCNLWDVLPHFVCQALAEALPALDKSVRGFAHPDAVLTAVETRSSSPVRIDRDGYQAAGLKGLYPCGEGAGYAGGIMSAAVDGIRTAEALCARIR
ncbi:hypothetical protein SAMN02745823_01381 [Sporobacter termitidis DSM 10068]|uniref:FAD-dependent protein C-terminal domain-containing protein n=1 Tax=Sporobacter termitidis DSM 10068 TaxID=1123282 RepID=A0A1M5WVH6_9FIRM|nr:hypothetical protein [Sporobacter termitidis]SHH91003.1 hypothetical protein SAMN02745823_01381 [Sporobacter termitidis DSM 10068]